MTTTNLTLKYRVTIKQVSGQSLESAEGGTVSKTCTQVKVLLLYNNDDSSRT